MGLGAKVFTYVSQTFIPVTTQLIPNSHSKFLSRQGVEYNPLWNTPNLTPRPGTFFQPICCPLPRVKIFHLKRGTHFTLPTDNFPDRLGTPRLGALTHLFQNVCARNTTGNIVPSPFNRVISQTDSLGLYLRVPIKGPFFKTEIPFVK